MSIIMLKKWCNENFRVPSSTLSTILKNQEKTFKIFLKESTSSPFKCIYTIKNADQEKCIIFKV